MGIIIGSSDNLGSKFTFPPFVQNTKSVFFEFSDNTFEISFIRNHKCFHCLDGLLNEYFAGMKNKKCYLDNTDIYSQEEDLFFIFLTDDKDSILYDLKFKHFKVSNFKEWNKKKAILSELQELVKKGEIDNKYLKWLNQRLI
jgi:hypothetical protein